MAETTGISWTDHTFNLVWGCERVSPGCAHCYAADLSARYGFDVWGKGPKHGKGARRVLSASYWQQPIRWDRKAATLGKRARVFCSSMADVFEDHPTVEREREKLWPLIGATPNLDWLILTKRPEHVMSMVPLAWHQGFPSHVWLGTSVENQHWADIRIPILLSIPAKIRFLSCEPLLGSVDLNEAAWGTRYARPPIDVQVRQWHDDGSVNPLGAIDWVITGGESGPKHRPFRAEWAWSIRDQCQAAGVAFFHKQNGGATSKSGGDLLDGKQYHEWPVTATEGNE